MNKNARHNRPKKKEMPVEKWESIFNNLRDVYGTYYKEKK
jgi:hypothetical protein